LHDFLLPGEARNNKNTRERPGCHPPDALSRPVNRLYFGRICRYLEDLTACLFRGPRCGPGTLLVQGNGLSKGSYGSKSQAG